MASTIDFPSDDVDLFSIESMGITPGFMSWKGCDKHTYRVQHSGFNKRDRSIYPNERTGNIDVREENSGWVFFKAEVNDPAYE